MSNEDLGDADSNDNSNSNIRTGGRRSRSYVRKVVVIKIEFTIAVVVARNNIIKKFGYLEKENIIF